jgi:hypothetical protein
MLMLYPHSILAGLPARFSSSYSLNSPLLKGVV